MNSSTHSDSLTISAKDWIFCQEEKGLRHFLQVSSAQLRKEDSTARIDYRKTKDFYLKLFSADPYLIKYYPVRHLSERKFEISNENLSQVTET